MRSVSKMRPFLATTISSPVTFPPPRSLPSAPAPFLPVLGLRPLLRRAPSSLRSAPPRPAGAPASRHVDGRGSLMDARPPPSGEIHVICGPMFAGKTTALLRRVQAESNGGRTVALIKSNKDNRYGLDSIVTHDGMRMQCWALPDLSTFRATLGAEVYDKESMRLNFLKIFTTSVARQLTMMGRLLLLQA
uniref:Thymidine kinase n=1 Tax=Anthurium amnicola TaxID=1678845 RepID=A0A1D1ZK70_9ARAE